jgi:HEAT repeat protein
VPIDNKEAIANSINTIKNRYNIDYQIRDQACLQAIQDLVTNDFEESYDEIIPILVELLQRVQYRFYGTDDDEHLDTNISRCAHSLLIKIGPQAVPYITPLLSNKYDRLVKANAIKILGEIGDKRAIEPIKVLLYDPYAMVWVTARDVLKEKFNIINLEERKKPESCDNCIWAIQGEGSLITCNNVNSNLFSLAINGIHSRCSQGIFKQ